MSVFDTNLRTPSRIAAANLNQRRDSVRSMNDRVVAFPVSPVSAVAAAPAVSAASADLEPGTYGTIGKRLLDIILVTVTAPFWMPLVALFALLVARDGHSPFYTQTRVGRNGDVFRMFKLRSMVPDAEAKLETYLASDPKARAEWDATQKLKNDPRITPIGRVIRKTSVDELPQLINVLLGHMSLVGPRPFMVSQDNLYKGQAYYRLRPGLTGLWQVSDRNDCDFVQRVDFDEAYGRTLSLRTDVSVLWRTVAVVLRGTGY